MHLGIFEIFILTVILLNITVSIFLVRRSDLDTIQKVSQIIIVWLIPIVAAIGLWLLNRNHDDKKETVESKAFGGGAYDRGGIGPGEGGNAGGGD